MDQIKEKSILKDRLELALEEITNSKLLSQSDVLSLETTLGENLFTNVRKINLFTSNQSSVGVDFVISQLKDKIKAVNAELVRDPDDILDKLSNFSASLHVTKDKINKTIATISSDKMKLLLSDKYGYIYESIDGIDTLVDLRDKDFLSNLMHHGDYLLALCKEGNDEYDNVFHEVVNTLNEMSQQLSTDTVVEFIPLPMWSMLLNIISEKGKGWLYNRFPTNLQIISLNKINYIINNIGVVNQYFDDIISQVNDYFKGRDSYARFRYTITDIDVGSYNNLLNNMEVMKFHNDNGPDKCLIRVLEILLKC